MGSFEPRKPPLENLSDYEDNGVAYIIKDPEVYRGRVRWTDAGSRYEGSPIFRRIDGAAERVEIDFSALAQPLQFVPQIVQWPSDEASNDAEAAVAPAGEAAGAPESSPPGRLPEESSQTL